jgi:parallel beta-helix repeat protein
MRRISLGFATVSLLVTAGCHVDGDILSPSRFASEWPKPTPSAAVTVSCGESIVTDLEIANDLVCAGDGLIIDADEITIDLNGHVITGSGTGNGITVRARQNVVIHGGTIMNFVTGIFVANSSHVLIKETRLTQNREGVFLNGSSDNVVKENEVWNNQLRGIMLRPTLSGAISTRNQVDENTLRENPSGILVFGQPGNTFKDNSITGSSVAAFDFTGGGASGNLIIENLLETSAVGIRFGSGWTGNSIRENRLLQNTCGMQGATIGNALTENEFLNNGSDFC